MLNSTLFSIKNFADYDVLKSQKIVSLVIGGEDFSRLGEWSASQLQEIYLDAKKIISLWKLNAIFYQRSNSFYLS